jgi:hypothetical protein
MDVDDAAAESFDERLRVYPVIARIDDELHAVALEKVTHRGIAFLRGGEGFLRKLAERDALFASEGGAPARRPVGRHRHNVEAVCHQVA